MAKEKVLVALGGNALQQKGEKGTVEEQMAHIHETCLRFLEILEAGHSLLITHGNGPQVGSILLKNEYAEDKLPPMPLDVCGAESQGMIGYLIQKQLYNVLKAQKRKDSVVTLCTQTLVEASDPAFKKPSKPIGPFYTEKRAHELRETKGWQLIEQVGKGFRRVVPSPLPLDIVEAPLIEKLLEEGVIVIACGGGGIPVIQDKEGNLQGVEAVIDKDRTAALLGKKVGADTLLILTDVEFVSLNFGAPTQKNLEKLTVQEAETYLKEGEFGVGSMGPKVEAACDFVTSGGKKAVISSLDKAIEALEGKVGTTITK